MLKNMIVRIKTRDIEYQFGFRGDIKDVKLNKSNDEVVFYVENGTHKKVQ